MAMSTDERLIGRALLAPGSKQRGTLHITQGAPFDLRHTIADLRNRVQKRREMVGRARAAP